MRDFLGFVRIFIASVALKENGRRRYVMMDMLNVWFVIPLTKFPFSVFRLQAFRW